VKARCGVAVEVPPSRCALWRLALEERDRPQVAEAMPQPGDRGAFGKLVNLVRKRVNLETQQGHSGDVAAKGSFEKLAMKSTVRCSQAGASAVSGGRRLSPHLKILRPAADSSQKRIVESGSISSGSRCGAPGGLFW